MERFGFRNDDAPPVECVDFVLTMCVGHQSQHKITFEKTKSKFLQRFVETIKIGVILTGCEKCCTTEKYDMTADRRCGCVRTMLLNIVKRVLWLLGWSRIVVVAVHDFE